MSAFRSSSDCACRGEPPVASPSSLYQPICNSESGAGTCCQPAETPVKTVAIPTSLPASSRVDDLDAAFEEVVFLEDRYTNTGREAGQTVGEKMGLEEGFDFGSACPFYGYPSNFHGLSAMFSRKTKGLEHGLEVGYYAGVIAAVLRLPELNDRCDAGAAGCDEGCHPAIFCVDGRWIDKRRRHNHAVTCSRATCLMYGCNEGFVPLLELLNFAVCCGRTHCEKPSLKTCSVFARSFAC
jgi:hypothetical protein